MGMAADADAPPHLRAYVDAGLDGAKWQAAKCSGATSRSGGAWVLQRSVWIGQRP
jgi:hypothetical protein